MPDSQKWIRCTEQMPPEDFVLLIGCWPHERDERIVGHHIVVEALRTAAYQVCYINQGQWMAFYCGGYDAQLVPPMYWRRLDPLP